jgi:hypothetical protein
MHCSEIIYDAEIEAGQAALTGCSADLRAATQI